MALGCRVFAEVMDKEPTITQNWIYAALGGLIAVAAWRWRWWIGLPYSVVWFWGIWTLRQELTDPSVGPAILREAGQQYFTHFYLSTMLALVLQCAAIYVRWRASTSQRAA